MKKLSKMEKAHRWAKKNTLSLVAIFGVLLVGGLGVKAFTGGNSAINVNEGGVVNVGTIVVESGSEGGIGAAVFTTPGTNLTDLNVDNDLSVDGDAEIDGTLQVDGATTFNGTVDFEGLTFDVTTGSFTDASTTIFAVQNPNSTTTTVDLAILNITGFSTTSVYLSVATSTVATPASYVSSTKSLFNDVAITGTTTPYLVNGVLQGANLGTPADANSQTRITVGPSEYVVGMVTALDDGTRKSVLGVTGGNNTFAGTYFLRWLQ